MADSEAAEQITNYLSGLSDWRGKLLARLRKVIRDASPSLVKSGNGTRRFGRRTEMWLRLALSRIT